jgi:hypothetical protein
MTKDVSTSFGLPSQPTTLEAFLLSQDFAAIPLHKYPTGHFYTQVVLNEQPARFLVDTGSGFTLFDLKQKDKFDLQSIPSTDVGTGAGGTGLVIELSEHNNLRLGPVNFTDCLLRILTLESVNARFREFNYPEIDGALGADLLTEGQAIIDYVNLRLYLKRIPI